MARKLKLTGFARLFIAMMVIIPLAYLGGTYIKGEDPVEFLNKQMNSNTAKDKAVEASNNASEAVQEQAKVEPILEKESPALAPPAMEKQGEVQESDKDLTDKLNQMYDENTVLKDKIKALEEQLKAKKTTPTTTSDKAN